MESYIRLTSLEKEEYARTNYVKHLTQSNLPNTNNHEKSFNFQRMRTKGKFGKGFARDLSRWMQDPPPDNILMSTFQLPQQGAKLLQKYILFIYFIILIGFRTIFILLLWIQEVVIRNFMCMNFREPQNTKY